jgi:hypothetical protein
MEYAMQDQYDQFIGKEYASVSDQISKLAQVQGLQVLPWPSNIGLVSEDAGTLIVYINNDIDDIILAIKIV